MANEINWSSLTGDRYKSLWCKLCSEERPGSSVWAHWLRSDGLAVCGEWHKPEDLQLLPAIEEGAEPVKDIVDCCCSCPFLYVGLPYGQNNNRCLYPKNEDGGRKLYHPMFTAETLKKSFPPASRWDWVERGREEAGSSTETIESGFTPEWCPLKAAPVLVEWRS